MAKLKRPQRNSIPGSFAWRLIEMLESPAHRVLSLSARRLLDRLEIELYRHGGKPEENGRLPCTYEHFAEFGIHRDAIAPAIRELVALGFLQITRAGCAGNAGYRLPTLYRLTYRHTGSSRETTDGWRQIASMDEATAIAEKARRGDEKKKSTPGKRHGPRPKTIGGKHFSPPPETMTTVPPPETMTTSISCGEGHRMEGGLVAGCRRATPSAAPPFALIEASYKIVGRAEPLVVFTPKSRMPPLAEPCDISATEEAA